MANLLCLRIAGAGLLGACAGAPPPPTIGPAPPLVVAQVAGDAQGRRIADAPGRCTALVAQAPSSSSLRLDSADYIADGLAYAVHPVSRRVVGDPLPAHCLVRGRLEASSAAPGGRFEMRLPTNWNGRLLHQGTNDPERPLAEAYGRNTGALGLEDNGLARGFAVLAGDVGLRRRHPTAPPVAGQEGAERAWVVLATAAKQLAALHYGKPPDRSYFVGCGEGGREGVEFAERWPWVFDGIVAVAPTLRAADAAIAATWALRQFRAIAPRDGGAPGLARAFGAADLFTVASAILKQCDALDGAEDGFVMDMARCRFDPAALTCMRGQTADCLAEAQVAALRTALAGPRDGAGRALYVEWPWDPGLAAPGWRVWTLGDASAGQADDARHAELRPHLAQPAAGAAIDGDLRHFAQRDGRLLLMHGAADPVVSAWATVAYQRRADTALGGADAAAEVVRSFVVPGMNHCAGGPATDRFDGLEAIVKWVEFGQPPERIEARGSAVLRDETRPLCAWPKVARYRGAGRLQDSASYACR